MKLTLKMFLRLCQALSPNCKQVTRLQSFALDAPLSTVERVGLRVHLLGCKWCRRYGRQLRFLRIVARKHDTAQDGPAGQALSPEARERIKHALRDEMG